MTVDAELGTFRAVIVAAANRYVEEVKRNSRHDPGLTALATEYAALTANRELLAAARVQRKMYDLAVSKVVHDPSLLFPGYPVPVVQ